MALCLNKVVENELRALSGNNVSQNYDSVQCAIPNTNSQHVRFLRFAVTVMQSYPSGLQYRLEYLCVWNAVADIELWECTSVL